MKPLLSPLFSPLFASLLLAVPTLAQEPAAQEPAAQDPAAQDPAAQDNAGLDWIQDFAAAKAKAKAEKKDLLIDFTGSDWCGWCIKLDKEVFSTEAFGAEAPKQYVFVKLDFPRNKELVTDDVRAQNAQLQMEFGVKGFPTIFLTDAEGRPYAQTGYQAGGPEKYLESLTELRKGKVAYDAGMQKAKGLKGGAKAKAMSEALSALDADLVLQHYDTEVAEAIALDADGKAGVKEQWEVKKKEHDAAAELDSLQSELNKLASGRDWSKVTARCDEIIKENKAKSHAQFATIFKAIAAMEGNQDLEGALKLLDEAKAIDPDSKLAPNCDRIAGQMKAKAKKDGDK